MTENYQCEQTDNVTKLSTEQVDNDSNNIVIIDGMHEINRVNQIADKKKNIIYEISMLRSKVNALETENMKLQCIISDMNASMVSQIKKMLGF